MKEHKHRWKLWNTTKQVFDKDTSHVVYKNEYICECGEKQYRNPTAKQLKNIGGCK